MRKEERKFRKVFERLYNEYCIIENKEGYDYAKLNTAEEIAEEVFGIDYEKLEEKLLKKFKKEY